MAHIILPSRWTSQPQFPVGIDWGNPITSGLVLAADLNKGIDVGPYRLSLTPASGATKKGYKHGVGLDFPGTSYVDLPNIPIFRGNNGTVVFATDGVSTDATAGYVAYSLYNSSVPYRYIGGFFLASRVFMYDDAYSLYYGIPNTEIPSSPLVIATRHGPTRYYSINGRPATAVTNIGNGWGNPSSTASAIGARKNGASLRYYTDIIPFVFAWDRPLSDSELQSISGNPWQIFQPLQRRIWVPSSAGGGVTGTGAVTESGDTAAAAGKVGHRGTAAITEAGDIAAAAGTSKHVGTAAITESADTAAAAGKVGHRGTSALTETGDVAEATGTVGTTGATGTAAITESPDTAAATGLVGHRGTAAITEAGDIAEATGTVGSTGITGTAAITESADTAAAIGTVGHLGSAAVIEAGDIAVAQGITVLHAPAGGGIGHGGKRKKKRVYIERDGNLHVFMDADQAEAFIEATKAVQDVTKLTSPRKIRKAAKAVEKAIKETKPEIVFPLAVVKTLAPDTPSAMQVEQLIKRAEWANLVALYERWVEDDDEEVLLLAA